jgi:indole-3-glycerol phosphate synthase
MILQQIAKSVKEKLEERRSRTPFAEMEKRAKAARQPHAFAAALAASGIHAIAEVKFRSPALGVIESASEARAVRIAESYVQNGARAISVLTEEQHFHGSPAFLRAIRKAAPEALLLMKDFVIDEYQVLEARANGADAVLLIVSLLGAGRVGELLRFAQGLGLTALIEVHDEEELQAVLPLAPALVGVNNRNLKTMTVSLETSFRLVGAKPAGTTMISESGIKTSDEIRRLREAGYSGVLIGTSLMGKADPGVALRELLQPEGA